MPINMNPAPQYGAGPYGAVPGPLSVPDNNYTQFNAAIPGFKGTGTAASGVINSQIAGQVNPDVQNLIQQKAAAMGTSTGTGNPGMPGSFSSNNALANLGLTSTSLQNTGMGNYLNFLSGVAPTLTNPDLAFTTEQQNAVDAAAPNPAAAAATQQNEFDNYLKTVHGGGQNGNPMHVGLTWAPGADPTHIQQGAPGS